MYIVPAAGGQIYSVIIVDIQQSTCDQIEETIWRECNI